MFNTHKYVISYTNQMQQNTLYLGLICVLKLQSICVTIEPHGKHLLRMDGDRMNRNLSKTTTNQLSPQFALLSDDEVKEWRNNSILDLAPDFSEIRTKSNV